MKAASTVEIAGAVVPNWRPSPRIQTISKISPQEPETKKRR